MEISTGKEVFLEENNNDDDWDDDEEFVSFKNCYILFYSTCLGGVFVTIVMYLSVKLLYS